MRKFILAFAVVPFLFSETASAESCAKVKAIATSSCESLKVDVDLTACGVEGSANAKIVKCDYNKFTAEVKKGSKAFTIHGSGAGWGDTLSWDVDSIDEAKSEAKSEAKATVVKHEPKREPKQRVPASIESDENHPKVSSLPPSASSTPAPAPAAPTPTPAPQAAATPAPQAAEKKFEPSLAFNGDIRQRFEQLTNEKPAAGKESTYRQWRLRARAGVKAQATQDLVLEFRLATGTGGPSTNQTFGDAKKAFRSYDFLLDRASAQWTPIENHSLIVGRTANPYVTVGENDLIFDTDVNVDGISIVGDQKLGSIKLSERVGSYVLSEAKDSTSDKDVNLNSVQLLGSVGVATDLSVTVQAAYHQFENVKDHTALVTGDFGGNSNAASVYTNDYSVASVGGEVSGVWKKPITLYYEYVMNTAISSERDGSIVGLKFGKLKAAKDWYFAIDYRELKKDAVFGVTTDGDSFGGGTDGFGTRLSAGYAISKNFNFAFNGYMGSKSISGAGPALKRDKFQIDLNFKF